MGCPQTHGRGILLPFPTAGQVGANVGATEAGGPWKTRETAARGPTETGVKAQSIVAHALPGLTATAHAAGVSAGRQLRPNLQLTLERSYRTYRFGPTQGQGLEEEVTNLHYETLPWVFRLWSVVQRLGFLQQSQLRYPRVRNNEFGNRL